MRNHGFFLYLQGFILHTFPWFTGISPCRRALELGAGGRWAQSRSRRAAAAGHGPNPAALGPTARAEPTRFSTGTLALSLGDASRPVAGRIGSGSNSLPGRDFSKLLILTDVSF